MGRNVIFLKLTWWNYVDDYSNIKIIITYEIFMYIHWQNHHFKGNFMHIVMVMIIIDHIIYTCGWIGHNLWAILYRYSLWLYSICITDTVHDFNCFRNDSDVLCVIVYFANSGFILFSLLLHCTYVIWRRSVSLMLFQYNTTNIVP